MARCLAFRETLTIIVGLKNRLAIWRIFAILTAVGSLLGVPINMELLELAANVAITKTQILMDCPYRIKLAYISRTFATSELRMSIGASNVFQVSGRL